MKLKGFATAIAIILALIFVVIGFTSVFGEHYKENLAGRPIVVSWKYVNVRAEPNLNGEILYTLNQGDTVTLTGNAYDYFDGPSSSWVQISDGNWVVVEAFAGNWQ